MPYLNTIDNKSDWYRCSEANNKVNDNSEKDYEAEMHVELDVLESLTTEYVDIFVMDPNKNTSTTFKVHGKILDKNSRFERPYGETWNNYTLKFVHPEDRERVISASEKQVVLEKLSYDTQYIIEYRIIYDGETHHHQCTFFSTYNGMICFAFRDIDAIVYKERERVRLITTYSEIIANAGLGVWAIKLKDGEMPRMSANEKMRDVMGITTDTLSEEDIYMHWHSRILPTEMMSVQNSINEMLEGKFSENTYKWEHPAKGVIYNRCGGTAEYLPDGTIYLTGYHADVTDIVTAEQRQKQELATALEEAEKANRAKTVFLSNMSHDIRTPMNAILGYASLMEKHLNEPEILTDYLGKLKTSGDVLLSFINNILDISRIDSGKEEIRDSLLDLGDSSKSVVPIFESIITQKNVNFLHAINVQHRYIYCDTTKIRQIWVNLLSNAIKYTPSGGTVELNMQELPSDIPGVANFVCIVKDNGIGISENYLPHIFELFSREKTTTESNIVGSGLGMPLVKKLVDLMNGHIEVHSKVGEGTIVEVFLSHRYVEAPPELINSENQKTTERINGKGKRLLLAEDNDLNAEIATEILNDEGFLIERAKDGIEVIGMMRQAPARYYNAILMDIQMPNMDGLRATKLLRAFEQPEKALVPIIAMTANAFEEDKRIAIEAGMNGYISKPIDRDNLIEILGGLL